MFVKLEGGRDDGLRLVVRLEQPDGEIFRDTDIAIQARVIAGLVACDIPVPRLIGMEQDTAFAGARFLVMDHREGRGFPQAPSYLANGWVKDAAPAERAMLWRNALGTIARINRLGAADGFSFLDRPQYGDGPLPQYLGWLRAWRDDAIGERDSRVIDAALRVLESDRPTGLGASVVWGDANPSNLLFAPDHSVSAVLDFEAAALAPAEVDLGWWLYIDRRRTQGLAPLEGVPDRDGVIAIYEAALGRSVVAIDYFEILGGIRMALVIASTVTRLVDRGLLPAGTTIADNNPMTATLAGLIDIEPPPVGDEFGRFVQAVRSR